MFAMEIYMRGISYDTTSHAVRYAIAEVVHGPQYSHLSSLPLNFDVRLYRDRKGGRNHSGQGALTLPTTAVGTQFLGQVGRTGLRIRGAIVTFQFSRHPLRADVVEAILRLPYLDPRAVEEEEERASQLRSHHVSVRFIQFGWECRDNVFSIEWEKSCLGGCEVIFDPEKKELRIKIVGDPSGVHFIGIRFASISFCSTSVSLARQPVIYFSLLQPPTFELDPAQSGVAATDDNQPKRQRLSGLDSEHERMVPYTSLAMRLVCVTTLDLRQFRSHCSLARMQAPKDDDVVAQRRGLFAEGVQVQLQSWLLELPWTVAFQVESLVKIMVVDFTEMLALKPKITELVHQKGEEYISGLLRHFACAVKEIVVEDYQDSSKAVDRCFDRCCREFETQCRSPAAKLSENVLDCLHAIVTPTTVFLEGPYPERSNRVIRSYPDHHERFMRVSFVDEVRLQYRFDREVDGAAFVRRRVGHILHNGLVIAGRQFQFLAYSQSALKEHAVWFVSPFKHRTPEGYVDVNACTIIEGLGTFAGLEFDPTLIRCPARYGARISQAFTATDASVSVQVEEIFPIPDVEANGSCFTDGVGTISREMAEDISRKLRAARRRPGRNKAHPCAFQVRFMGSKGMLSVDYTLSGRAICLRPSMIKFEAPESREIEIAQAFDKPGKYFLNRPLIMILEGLGVPYETFQGYQDDAVYEAQESTHSFATMAKLLETHGLGASFRLPSLMLGLDKLDVSPPNEIFINQLMEFAINHVLRELKQRARIPIPCGWTLVGVADVHNFLRNGQIFACIKTFDKPEPMFLEGPILISRSPTIAPGDVQIVRAIGRPLPGSPFAREPLPNTVVFSIQGERSLPSCLGGGDLDGDVYNLIPLNVAPEFRPIRLAAAAAYKPAPKKVLDRPSTMADVAEFFMEYINSDVLGIVAVNWLIIADQSLNGIFDQDCLTLADLHSDAVDYQKSGQPVPVRKIPKLKFRQRPDWSAPETVNPDSAHYYKSQRAIGKLFRAIDLPAVRDQRRASEEQYHRLTDDDASDLGELLSRLDLDTNEDPIYLAVTSQVTRFIALQQPVAEDLLPMFERFQMELQRICATHTLSHARSAILTEEEAVIGTIVAKTSQRRRRKELMSRMREQTDLLVRGIREELAGDDGSSREEWLERAYACWSYSLAFGKRFGAKSFGFVALGSIFEAIKAIEDADRGFSLGI